MVSKSCLILNARLPYRSGAGPWKSVVKMDALINKKQSMMKMKAIVSLTIMINVIRSFEIGLITKKNEKNLNHDSNTTIITK